MIWPLGVIIQGLTATSDTEIHECIDILREHTRARFHP